MPPKRKVQPSRQLKQTTLLNKHSTHVVSTSKDSSLVRTKRQKNSRIEVTDEDDEDANLRSIKLNPNKQAVASYSDSEGSFGQSVRKKRKPLIVRSDTSQSYASSDSARNDITSHNLSRKRKGKLPSRNIAPEVGGTRHRKRLKGRKTSTVLSSSESDVDIVDEVEQDRILGTRLRARDKKTAFQKNLEKLKRRKQGKPSESSSGDEDDEEESENNDVPFKGAKIHSDYDSLFDGDSSDSNSSDFIVEDDNTGPTPLPIQFSMESREDLAHQFKKIFQFFVHIAARPAKERHDFMKMQMEVEEYFSVPLQVARRKISGLRDSLVTSSVWRPKFKNALEKYPEFGLVPLDFATPACDACHLGGRMSTLTGRLSGFPYDRLGFEIMDEQDSSNSSDTDDSAEKRNKAEFYLGRFCAKRVRVFHEFTHWEYSLFKSIREEVDELHASSQSGGFFRIAYAGGKKPPQDLDDADGICDWLDERKLIEMEWQKMKNMMESARHLEMARKGGQDLDG